DASARPGPTPRPAQARAADKPTAPRPADAAARQAKGEDVIRSQFDDERLAADQAAQELIEGGAGQQEGFGDEA
ncbi:MAG: 50S ribosomal protein L9, partial [Brevundimonas sp.]